MTPGPAFSPLSPDEVRLLRTPAFTRARTEWLDWLSLVHGVLALHSRSAPRTPFAGPAELGALLEARVERLAGTPFHTGALGNTRALLQARRRWEGAEHGGAPEAEVEAYLDAVVGEYDEVTAPRHGPWAAGPMQAAERHRGPERRWPPGRS